MCGIAGIVGRISDENHSALERMTVAMKHRGPDGSGVWTSSPDARGFGCLLGHRRLAVIDLSSAADQPMSHPAIGTGHTVVFNGELYNFKDLRRDLQREGEDFTSTGDTEVLLRLLVRRGPDGIQQLRGMFAFALWDDRARRLLLARDPLGIKPLYVCQNPDSHGDWSLAFASEVRSILASGLLKQPRLDRRAIRSLLWNGFVAGPATAVEGIESVGAGDLWWTRPSGTVEKRTYWTMPPRDRQEPIDEAQLKEVIADSVARHLVADVPLGVFLSGGIDSSAVAALAQRANHAPVHTFTLSFDEQKYNEGEFARAIAKAIGTEHTEVRLTESGFAAALETAIDTLDQPTFDGLNSYYVSKAVREAGLTVALAGTGGDELFGGYPSFHAMPMLQKWAHRTRLLPSGMRMLGARAVSRVLAGSGRITPPQTRWAKLPDMVRAGEDITALYQLAYALFLPEFQERLLRPADADEMEYGLTPELSHRLHAEIAGRSPISAVGILEQRVFLGERLLRDTDAASMAVSLETRLPLVDSVVAEAVNRLPDSARFEPLGRKGVLRRVGLEGLDPALFERPKQGFVLPFDSWIRKSLGRDMDDTMRDPQLAQAVGLDGKTVEGLWSAYQEGARGLYWSRVWVLYILIRWCHRHRVLA
ncbi:MAG: asparagine synthase (glutamine-hydrolyzing) [Acidobacteria bacterium]|nr:asparagine synthase (glutamine-hydrolyzing) [Acidobacteriota bacterium]